jgi:RNA polymerase sigma-70 factor, ECF subfamily
VGESQPAGADQGPVLLALYDRSLPEVYGYLVSRCGDPSVAEDLTAETFLAAVDAVKRRSVADLTTAWLVGVARHKLVDHWRRVGREERKLALVAQQPELVDDPWETRLDVALARSVLSRLGAANRCALTLRYLDGLRVAEVAEEMGRTLHATEALLVRARIAFRTLYDTEGGTRGD